MLRAALADMRTDRDAWREQAATLALSAPIVPAAPSRPWWKQLAGRAG